MRNFPRPRGPGMCGKSMWRKTILAVAGCIGFMPPAAAFAQLPSPYGSPSSAEERPAKSRVTGARAILQPPEDLPSPTPPSAGNAKQARPPDSVGSYERSTAFQKALEHEAPPAEGAAEPTEGAEGGEGGGSSDLAAKFTSPTALLTSYQFVTQYNPIVEGTRAHSVQFLFRPVLPIPKSDWIPLPQIIRITAPVLSSIEIPGGSIPGGFGDVQLFDLFVLPLGKKLTVGAGPVAIFPTASSQFTGQGHYQIGPAFVTLYTGIPKWQLGFLVQDLLSIGDSNQPSVHQMIYQLIMTRHFERGWYMGLCGAPATVNWNTEKAQFPAGVALGRVFTVWKQPVNFSVTPTYYVGATDFQSRLQVQFNFSMIYGK